MSKAIENLEAAFQRAMAIRPRVGASRTWPRHCGRRALRATSGRYPHVRACI
jgi:hypothetical protein